MEKNLKNNMNICTYVGLPRCLNGKEVTSNAGAIGLIPASGRFPGGRHGYSLQYSCLDNPIDRGAWQATVHRVAKSQTRLKWLGSIMILSDLSHLSEGLVFEHADTLRCWELGHSYGFLEGRGLGTQFSPWRAAFMRISSLSLEVCK